MKSLLLSIVSVLCLFFTSPTFAVQGDDILGFWVTEGGEARVEVFKKGTRYYARIVGLKEPHYKRGEVKGMDGKVRVDHKNPDPSLRDHPLMGLKIMADFSFEAGRWVGGKIYDPNNGKTYSCKLSLVEDGSLEVRGYVGVSWLGRTTVWERTENYLEKILQMLGMNS